MFCNDFYLTINIGYNSTIIKPDLPRINLTPLNTTVFTGGIAFKWIFCSLFNTNFVSPRILWWSNVYSGVGGGRLIIKKNKFLILLAFNGLL